MNDVSRPITTLILALGGEGGGVLADWVIDTARTQGLAVQGTSVPGVAQRTGATSYYIEMLPVPLERAADPVLCLSPALGEIDLLVSSELLETARAIERGLSDPQRTTLISSSARVLTVAEKMQMGDARVDEAALREAAHALSHRCALFDMAEATREAGTIVSSVMFGAICASGVLPLTREACEGTIRAAGLAVAASLRGFAAGFEAAAQALARGNASHEAPQGSPVAQPIKRAADPAPITSSASTAPERRHDRDSLARLLKLGRERLLDYQGESAAALYEARMTSIVEAETALAQRAGTSPPDHPVARATARFLALWMSYEDIIRVAQLKLAPDRLARIRQQVSAQAHEPVIVHEFLKPGIEEIAAILPPALASRLLAWAQRRSIRTLSQGITLDASSLIGHAMLRALALLRPLRPRSSRWLEEQALIERWLAAIRGALEGVDPGGARTASLTPDQARDRLELARHMAWSARLLKGYSRTQERGRARFVLLLERLLEPPLRAGEDAGQRARSVAEAISAAMADSEGRALHSALGLPPPAAKAQPVRWVARKAPSSPPPPG